MRTVCLLAIVFVLVESPLVVGEVYTSMADMEALLETEKELTLNVRNFIEAEEARIKQIKKFLEEYERVWKEAKDDAPKYLANPINAYVLVKRLTSDLKEMESVLIADGFLGFRTNLSKLQSTFQFPTKEDLNGAAVALTRLQDTYKLSTEEMADGVLLGKKYSRNLTAHDCFELGRQLYNNKDYKHAVPWFRESLKKELQERRKSVSRQEVMEYLEFSLFSLGKVSEALQLANQILLLDPDHERIKVNKMGYEQILHEKRHDGVGETPVIENESKYYNEFFDEYKSLCRGETKLDPEIESQLRCRYVHRDVPYLRLGPVKEEEASLSPRIVVYHDVLYDSEIATIRRIAQPRFERASVYVVHSGESFTAPYRIAKTSFIRDSEHEHIQKISQRIGIITELDMSLAESLQVVNYGIGGQYEPHNDHASDDVPNAYSPEDEDWGNRIATWLFYMTDVEAGGATVFPRINVALWPRKGSAALWHNLLPNGDGDDRTFHASCPVLTGNKWVCNKWIHERTQLFRRPCKLRQDAQH